MAGKVSLKAVISGRVQGVYFRDFTRRHALELKVSGYVRNLPGGGVEVLAEGERSALEILLKQLEKGSPHASVEHITVSWGKARGEENGFNIRY